MNRNIIYRDRRDNAVQIPHPYTLEVKGLTFSIFTKKNMQ